MKRIIYLTVAVGLAAALPTSCRKPPEEVKGPETAAPEAPAEPAASVTLDGMYVGGGADADGNAYTCEVEIAPARSVYWVTYHVGDRIPYPGVGLRRGDLFVVGYRDDRDIYGVVAYTIKPDGSLEGISADQDSTETGTETLRKK
ncbi:MAG TPA: hypothetical protein VMX79_11365 [bacterium]|nr:hypothetical protein [bacterium]